MSSQRLTLRFPPLKDSLAGGFWPVFFKIQPGSLSLRGYKNNRTMLFLADTGLSAGRWQWQWGLETICWNDLNLRAIYQADCNEQKHYLRTFCPPLNTISVLCRYLVSAALRDRPVWHLGLVRHSDGWLRGLWQHVYLNAVFAPGSFKHDQCLQVFTSRLSVCQRSSRALLLNRFYPVLIFLNRSIVLSGEKENL